MADWWGSGSDFTQNTTNERDALLAHIESRMAELYNQWDLNDYPDGVEPANVQEANVAYSELKKIQKLLQVKEMLKK